MDEAGNQSLQEAMALDEDRPFDVAGEVNGLRWFIARASAMGRALEGSIEQPWGDDAEEDRRRLEDLSHLGGAMVEALRAATEAGNQIAARLTKLADNRLTAALNAMGS
jgi:hypothetical protein